MSLTLNRLLHRTFLIKRTSLNIRCALFSSLTPSVTSYLKSVESRYQVLNEKLASATLPPKEMIKASKEVASLGDLVAMIGNRDKLIGEEKDLKSMKHENISSAEPDAELTASIDSEIELCKKNLEEIEQQIIRKLTPQDEADECNVILEVRAGTGGDEASLFASELYSMYQRYCKLMGWRWEELSFSRTDIGGFKEAQASISGEGVYKRLKFEQGVHRVQRIPVNDTKIQTSAASVVILPEVEEVEVELRPQDLKIEVMRSQGAGGQNVNKTESAVRMTHIPTGCVVSMQDERSQIQNRAKAMRYLRARVYEVERRKQREEQMQLRLAAGGTGDRSDKIRTYQFPQDRVTDHRVGMTINHVEGFMEGDGSMLSEMIDALVEDHNKKELELFIQRLESSADKNTVK